jgi:hypothetical protein
MAVLTIECYNYKQHKNRKIVLDGKSAILMGDIKKGKSNIMKLILAHTNQGDYPSNPLSDGENEGWTKTTHKNAEGKVYTIQRKFKRNEDTGEVELERMWVYPPVGNRSSMEKMVDDVFGGAFKNGYFDYIEYFYKNKTAVTRYAYFVKAIGGAEIESNVTKINAWMRERGQVGTSRDAKWEIVEASSYDIETFEEQNKYYSQEFTLADCQKAKDEYVVKETKDVSELRARLVKETEIIGHIEQHRKEEAEIDIQIAELQRQLQALSNKKALLDESRRVLANQLLPGQKFKKLTSDIETAEKHNSEIAKKANDLYNEKVEEMVKFRTEKEKFNAGLDAFDEWEKLDAKWNELDEKIKFAKAANDQMLQKRIPIPELSIGELDEKPAVLYKGKEFSEDNLSTGERLQLTSAIQMALNPKGDNFIVVPEAQSLGSEKDAVMKELEKHNVQYLIEMTVPDEEFKVEIIEHQPNKDEVPVRKKHKK